MTLSIPASQALSALIKNLPPTPEQIHPEQWETLRQELTNLVDASVLELANGKLLASDQHFREAGEDEEATLLQREPAMQAAWENDERYRTILVSIGDAVITADQSGCVTYLNPVAERLTGWRIDEACGLPMRQILTLIDDRTGEPVASPVEQVLTTGAVECLDGRTSLVSRAGQVIPIEDSAAPIQTADGRTRGVVMVFHDVSEKRKKEDELERLNRTLKALSSSSQAMLRATDENAYLAEVCQIITRDCGHALVWIGFAQDDAAQSVRPVAYAGFEAGYLETLHITWADSDRGRGPTGTAIRTAQAVQCRNMLTDPRFAPWRAEAIKRGYAASIALPLQTEGRCFGALTIYSSQPDPFTEDEVRLLSELANDLAYGISAIRLRAAHEQVEAALQESEARYRRLFQSMSEGFALHEILCDAQGQPYDYRFLDVNPGFEQLTGLKQADVSGKRKSEIPQLEGDDPSWIEIYGKVALTGEAVHFENYSPPLHAIFDVFAFRPAPMQFAVIFVDITERRQLEESIAQNKAQVEVQRRLIDQREQERLQIARDLHDGPMQELAAALFTLQCAIQDAPDEAHSTALEQLRGSLQHQLQELRDFACELRPPTLTRFGLRTAIKSHVDTFRVKHPEIEVRYRLPDVDSHQPEIIQLAMFRIYQQAMHNIARHARASLIEIRLKKSRGQLALDVRDNGIGFNVPKDWLELASQKHLGIVGMRERAEALNGQLTIQSKPGKGTRVTITVPLDGHVGKAGS